MEAAASIGPRHKKARTNPGFFMERNQALPACFMRAA